MYNLPPYDTSDENEVSGCGLWFFIGGGFFNILLQSRLENLGLQRLIYKDTNTFVLDNKFHLENLLPRARWTLINQSNSSVKSQDDYRDAAHGTQEDVKESAQSWEAKQENLTAVLNYLIWEYKRKQRHHSWRCTEKGQEARDTSYMWEILIAC